MSLDYKTELLSVLLNCGTEDIKMLEGCNLSWEDIKNDCLLNRGEITLNNLLQSMFNIALDELKEEINRRVDLLESFADEDPCSFDENMQTELNSLKELEPFMDIETVCDFGDTAVRFIKYEDVYREYISGALDDFEDQTGFEIE